jgi:hypothetical protein
MKSWEIIAENLSKAGWSWGCVSAIDANGRTIWIADAHRGDGKRFVVRSDEKLTAFMEVESSMRCPLALPPSGPGLMVSAPTFSASPRRMGAYTFLSRCFYFSTHLSAEIV